MPYGMPELNTQEHDLLYSWLEQYEKMNDIKPLTDHEVTLINQWESFFNSDSLKQQLTSRYLYEYLFLNNLYFHIEPSHLRFLN
ncbi:fatty acid cis/trans isomerase [Aliivibrio finisterrensis]|uniref:fatty acid cis/trans isomerase n=1 Tax=Aliivibrio finisterrensis TaxID=511998 RepID=UPI001FCA8FF3|nr:fatty acid cis/trans isomerase [Aliivibrio finisterrensis]